MFQLNSILGQMCKSKLETIQIVSVITEVNSKWVTEAYWQQIIGM
jgi:hypothetical protein